MTDYEKDGEEKIPSLEETEEWAMKCFLAAGVLSDRGDYRKAVSLYQHAYRLRREEAPRTLNELNNIAWSYDTLGDREKAFALQENLCTLRSKVLGEDHPQTVKFKARLKEYRAKLDGQPKS